MIFMRQRPGNTGPRQSLAGWRSASARALVEAAPPIEMGVWINHTGKGAVEIRPCGTSGASANRLCGFIVWLKEPNKKNGEPLTDGHNPEAGKRRRTICGLPVLGSLQRVSGGWDNGWVYDPEQGSQFDAAIQLATRDRLVLTGYKGVKFFSKSFTWRRAPADLPALRPAARGAGDTERCAHCRSQDDLSAGAAAQGAAPRSRRAAGNGRVEPSFRPAHSAIKKPGRWPGFLHSCRAAAPVRPACRGARCGPCSAAEPRWLRPRLPRCAACRGARSDARRIP